MGRGRAKAKQTKVARELKYRSVTTDFASLEAELRVRGSASPDDIPPAYADLAAAYDDGDEADEDEDDGDPEQRSAQ
ncbi:MAG: DUF3073 domain-containing protein [Propionibacteriaceae bacterium]|jgi:hypothetical protein|nr:DUF3073 domain-containing protein [Propionibacteriaceae bacterium]